MIKLEALHKLKDKMEKENSLSCGLQNKNRNDRIN